MTSILVSTQNWLSSGVSPDVRLKIAACDHEYMGAFRLIHDSYCRAGLAEPQPHGLRVRPHQLLDTSEVFVATLRGEVICTLTLVQDGELGVPLEAVYPGEIASRRANGVRLGEVTCLADRRLSPKRFFGLFCGLGRLMAQYAARQGIDELWVACHPNHAALYERRMAFARAGDLCDYPAVRGNPAVLLRLDLQALPDSHPGIWRRFFGETINPQVLTPPAGNREVKDRFWSFVLPEAAGEAPSATSDRYRGAELQIA